ncbi:MAG TPA: ribonuclease HII [Syntrophobacteraceae bacterium]|nr:ribonuclease HII [Syntrophobacteraceae bacterium]
MRQQSMATSPVDLLHFEREAYRRGCRLVSGIDEVGRGPLAGPVVAAAVILPQGIELPGVRDSKDLTSAQRDARYQDILSRASAVGIGSIEPAEIDRINILQATFKAMIQAIESLPLPPDFLLIDGPYRLPVTTAQKGIPRGDQRSISIASASIVAKVYRDRLMCEWDTRYPAYGFAQNKGYGTARHLEALRRHGPCPLHRLSFRGVVS